MIRHNLRWLMDGLEGARHPGEGRGPEESAWSPAFAGVTLPGARVRAPGRTPRLHPKL